MHELCELAVNKDLLTPDQAAQCEELARNDSLPVAEALVKGGFLEEDQALSLLASYLGMRFVPSPAAEAVSTERYCEKAGRRQAQPQPPDCR